MNTRLNEQTLLEQLRSNQLTEAELRAALDQALAQDNTRELDRETLFELADHLAYTLFNTTRFSEAQSIAEQALNLGEDIALRHTLALSVHALGQSPLAITHLEQALRQLASENAHGDDPELIAMRADMQEHLAQFQQAQSQTLRALHNLERAAADLQTINDTQGYIRCKTQLAKLARELGDDIQASDHWLDILAAARAPDTAQAYAEHAARALLQLADLARDSENTTLENSLRSEAIQTLAQAGMASELAHTLFQLARLQSRRDAMWQAVWLMLAVTHSIEGLINAQAWLFMREDQKSAPEAALLAAAVWATIESAPEENIPADMGQQARQKRLALSHLFSCARLQGIPEHEIKTWMQNEKLRTEDGVIQTMLKQIENLPETQTWLFERSKFIAEDS